MGLFTIWRTVSLVLGDRNVALAAAVPHKEKEDKGGKKEDAAGDADAEADFDAGVGRAFVQGGAGLGGGHRGSGSGGGSGAACWATSHVLDGGRDGYANLDGGGRGVAGHGTVAKHQLFVHVDPDRVYAYM
jgi:hypothetical protein